mmetsp:Transcript_8307/g.37646  ORF Transcript_8307/g.37646 Transcript_8307/m.37646 type:complete len:281 (-) Transcript_8307:3855-4697(-)
MILSNLSQSQSACWRLFSPCFSTVATISRPVQNLMISTRSKPLVRMKSPGMSRTGPSGVHALSHLARLALSAPWSSCAIGGAMYRACRGSITGRLTSAPSIVRQPSFAARNCSVVSVQLSAIPETGIGNRFPSSSKNSIVAVKLRGFLLSKLTSTGSLCLAMPIIRPSGHSICSGTASLSAGSLQEMPMLSKPSLMSQSLRVVATPSGVGASRTSLSSNLILGWAPSPATPKRRCAFFVFAAPSRYTGTLPSNLVASIGEKLHLTVTDSPRLRMPNLGSN